MVPISHQYFENKYLITFSEININFEFGGSFPKLEIFEYRVHRFISR